MDAIFAHENKQEDDYYVLLGCDETASVIFIYVHIYMMIMLL